MAEHLLNCPQIRSPLQQVRGHRVTQPVGADIGGVRNGSQGSVNHSPSNPLVDACSSHANEHRTGVGVRQNRPSLQPLLQCAQRGSAKGCSTIPVSFSVHPDQRPVPIDIGQVETNQFSYPDAAGVKHLDDRGVPLRDRPILLRPGRFDPFTEVAEHRLHDPGVKVRGQATIGLGCLQPCRRVGVQTSGLVRPREEPSGCSHPAGHGGPRGARRVKGRYPSAKGPKVDRPGVRDSPVDEMTVQVTQIALIRPQRVRREVALPRKLVAPRIHKWSKGPVTGHGAQRARMVRQKH